LVILEAEGFQGESWTVQSEILEEHMLVGLAAEEELVPEPNAKGQPQVYDFFGLGQPGQMPFNL
jgi:hypothetical protein